jgi:Tol biopolymer transport system component
MYKRKLAGVVAIAGALLVLAAVPVFALSSKQNGRIIYLDYSSDTGFSNIYSMAPDGSDKRVIIAGTDGADVSGPQISPDGATIVYASTDWNTTPSQTTIMLADTDGDNQRVVADIGDEALADISWSPNNTQLIYASLDGATYEPSIHMVAIDGSNNQQVNISGLAGSSALGSIAWSGNNKLAYSLDGQLYVSAIDGTGATSITSDAGWGDASVMSAAWSPDSSKLVFVALECPGGGGCIVTVNSDGTNRQIAQQDPTMNSFCSIPVFQSVQWSPDGSKILFNKSIACM